MHRGGVRTLEFLFHHLRPFAVASLRGSNIPSCLARSMEEQTIMAADLIQQDIDINEPVGNLKKLLEPRLQISLDSFEICLQDIQVKAHI